MSPTFPARACLHDFIELAVKNKKSWARDVLVAASKLRFDCPPFDFSTATAKNVELYRKNVETQALGWLQHEIDSSVKLYLLQGRREPQKDKPPAHKT